MTNDITREQWLEIAAQQVLADLIEPLHKPRANLKLKFSVAYPPYTKPNSSVVAKCLPSGASEGRFNEIYLSPELDSASEVLGHLVHELIHALDDCASGHKGFFAKLARQVGLEGPLDATRPSIGLMDYLNALAADLGPLPHAKVNLESAHKAQKARQIKIFCGCGFQFYTSQTQIDRVLNLVGEIVCNCCGERMDIKV